MIPTNPDLRKFILQFLSDDELETLCFDYFPEATNEFGGGMSTNRKIIVLIGHCERRGRLADLHAALMRERAVAWKGQFTTEAAAEKPGFSEKTRFPDERDPRQVFLSHATVDAEFAHTLADDLRAEGWRVWIAPDSIQPGEKWLEAINRGLETSGVFIVALTPNAVASQMVRDETYAAIDLKRHHEIRFTALDVIESPLPVLWRQLQYITFRSGYESGLDKLLRWLDGDELSPPARISVREQEPELSIPKAEPDRHIHEKTGIELIRIPAGPFLYGDDKRVMDLPEYWIGRYPVTNAQFERFVRATNYRTTAEQEGSGYAWTGSEWDDVKGADWRHPGGPKTSIEGKDAHPVVLVSWHDTQAFCDWAGLALPTEEEWEKAARGPNGRVYPWGDDWADGRCNTHEAKVGGTTPVGHYSPQGDGPYGCADMAGNVLEWTGSWYDEKQARRVVRGGSWVSLQDYARAAGRYSNLPASRDLNVGCRLVRRPPSQAL